MFALQLGFTHFNLLKSILLRVDFPYYKCTWTKERKNCSKWPFNSHATKKLESELKVLILKWINIHQFLPIMTLSWPDIDPKLNRNWPKLVLVSTSIPKNRENIVYHFFWKSTKIRFFRFCPKNQFLTRKSLFVVSNTQNYASWDK